MEEKPSFWKKAALWISGRGFYAVLALCLVLIGASAWTLFRSLEPEKTESPVYYSSGVEPVPETAPKASVTHRPDAEFEERAPVHRVGVTPAPETEDEEDAGETVETDGGEQSFLWPLSGEVVLDYSQKELLWNVTMADWRTHDGVDIAAPMGTRVLSAAAGTVESVREDDLLGTVVVLCHENGVRSLYANLAATPTVEEGDTVAIGEVIGSVGDTALGEIGDESHLHFAMTRWDEPVNPAEYLPER